MTTTRWQLVRLIPGTLLCAAVAFTGFSGPYNLLFICGMCGLVAGSLWAPLVLLNAALVPALFVDTGTQFHADGGPDLILGAVVILGGGGLAALPGVLGSVTAIAGWRRVRTGMLDRRG